MGCGGGLGHWRSAAPPPPRAPHDRAIQEVHAGAHGASCVSLHRAMLAARPHDKPANNTGFGVHFDTTRLQAMAAYMTGVAAAAQSAHDRAHRAHPAPISDLPGLTGLLGPRRCATRRRPWASRHPDGSRTARRPCTTPAGAGDAAHAGGCAQRVAGVAGAVCQRGAAALGQRSVHSHHAEPAADHCAQAHGGSPVALACAALAGGGFAAGGHCLGPGNHRLVAQRRRGTAGGLAPRCRQESARQPQEPHRCQQPAGQHAKGSNADRAGRQRQWRQHPRRAAACNGSSSNARRSISATTSGAEPWGSCRRWVSSWW